MDRRETAGVCGLVVRFGGQRASWERAGGERLELVVNPLPCNLDALYCQMLMR